MIAAANEGRNDTDHTCSQEKSCDQIIADETKKRGVCDEQNEGEKTILHTSFLVFNLCCDDLALDLGIVGLLNLCHAQQSFG